MRVLAMSIALAATGCGRSRSPDRAAPPPIENEAEPSSETVDCTGHSALSAIDREIERVIDLRKLRSEGQTAFDREDLETAWQRTQEVFVHEPCDVPMVRLAVMVACKRGDRANAQQYVHRLSETTSDRKTMQRRCRRYGVELSW
jgi:hypothetical protein